MAKTRHMSGSMSRRGIKMDLVSLTMEFGEVRDDKHFLGRKGLETLLGELRSLERTVKKAMDKGGLVVVETGGRLITTYDFDSYDRRRLN